MNDQTPAAQRATVLRFDVPVGQGRPVSSGAVRKLQQSPIARQLLLSLAARDVSTALHEADRFVGQASIDVVVGSLTPQQLEGLRDRSSVAISLGDQVKRDVAGEKAALAILRGVDRGIRDGSILEHSQLAKLDLSTARFLAKLALSGGLDYLAGRPQ